MRRKILVFIIAILVPLVSHGQIGVIGIRTSDYADHSRLVLEMDAKSSYKIFHLNDPPRVVIDVENAKWHNKIKQYEPTSRIKSIRHSTSSKVLRVVLDVNQPLKVKKDFLLNAEQGKPYRLVVDLAPENDELDVFVNPIFVPEPVVRKKTEIIAPVPKPKKQRKPLIVIDAGHGGHDPGAIGRRGTKEKDITLAYSKELRKQLLKSGRYNVYMTRSNDSFVKLRNRVAKGRRVKGDLFVSIHANAHKNRRTRGWSVYTLSENASDKEAAALARKENKSGLINGVDLEQAEDELTALLIDMTQRDTKNLSASFAETLVSKTKHETKLLQNPHRFAGFRVLTGADIPSVLVELGYLTNRKEEKLLKSGNHKKKLAKAIVAAIDVHFSKYKID